jgi:hypothetical protein
MSHRAGPCALLALAMTDALIATHARASQAASAMNVPRRRPRKDIDWLGCSAPPGPPERSLSG